MNTNRKEPLPVAIIGGGPVGLAAAAHFVNKGENFVLFEAGNTVGSSMLKWGHVKMFSPWEYNVDKEARKLLNEAGWVSPNNEELPTGRELVENYLLPLSNLTAMKDQLHFNAKVLGVAKKGRDKLKTEYRDNVPFQLYVEIDGKTKIFEAKAIIDASGTWENPNPILSNGIWTSSERKLNERIYYGIPNFQELEERYKNKTVMVVGSGHSAINALLDLAALKEKHSNTIIYWVLRKKHVKEAYGGQENDGLQARGELGTRIQKLVDTKQVEVITPFYINEVNNVDGKISVSGESNGEETTFGMIDEIVVSTGFRPDTSFLNEIRLNLDSAVESVEALAPLIDPNIHSCGTVRPHGEAELKQPEKNFYIVGMKSYGRAPTFLLATGYEQVRSVVAYLTGDYQGAKDVQLELPETGVCKTDFSSSCCDSEGNSEKSIATSCCSEPMPVVFEIKKNSCC